MKYDESFINNDNSAFPQLSQLNHVLEEIVESLEQGREDIFEISEECRKQKSHFQLELLEAQLQTEKIIKEVDNLEKLEKQARLRLMSVNRQFRSYTEKEIKTAYDTARQLQIKLIESRNEEAYLRKKRDEIGLQIKQLEKIISRAENSLQNTNAAVKILRGNLDRISGSIEEIYRKQQMEMWIIEMQESERRKIARELHDGPAQNLASIIIRLDLINHLWDEGQDRISSELNTVKSMGQESLLDIRNLMFDLKPTLLDDESFATALRGYFDDYEAKYDFHIEFNVFGPYRKYDMSLEVAIYRLVQEALTNIRKHAGVNQATVKMEDKAGKLTLIIKDEGRGFDLDKVKENQESYGILGMKERVKLFEGEIDIISSPGRGTQITIKVPIKEEANIDGKGKGHNS
ncbi:MAG TPA: sensor histidine kinase [Syntrophomonadaceae bacterium]|nr:sensor histidine kinase [Syntrophomonadaceae bacterium]